MFSRRVKFSITRTWDNNPVNHDPVLLGLSPHKNYVVMEVDAPYFNDPPPPNGVKGKPYKNLWEYEVVEAFFLGENEHYLEVEFNPHGQHLLLLLSGRKKILQMCLPVEYIATIGIKRWQGIAKIPKSYFPPKVNLFNAYAIHGTEEKREYESLYPVPSELFDYPDFHRLEFFRSIDFSQFLGDNHSQSQVWKDALENSMEVKESV